jgi:hypothetical protein
LQTGLYGFGHWICPTFSPDSNKVFWTCSIIHPDMSGFSAKISFLDQNLIFVLSRPSIVIYVIMWRFHGVWIRSELLIKKIYQGISLYVILDEAQAMRLKQCLSKIYEAQSPTFLQERRFLMVIQVKILFPRNSHLLWAIFSQWVSNSSYHCYQISQSSLISMFSSLPNF